MTLHLITLTLDNSELGRAGCLFYASGIFFPVVNVVKMVKDVVNVVKNVVKSLITNFQLSL